VSPIRFNLRGWLTPGVLVSNPISMGLNLFRLAYEVWIQVTLKEIQDFSQSPILDLFFDLRVKGHRQFVRLGVSQSHCFPWTYSIRNRSKVAHKLTIARSSEIWRLLSIQSVSKPDEPRKSVPSRSFRFPSETARRATLKQSLVV
jgi:hypothetical protein